jgi:hypothetical protein
MNKKQTAIEWLELELSKLDYNKMSNDLYLFYMAQIFDQAREMEKNQMIDFTDDYVDNCVIPNENMAIPTIKDVPQYYNETYEN